MHRLACLCAAIGGLFLSQFAYAVAQVDTGTHIYWNAAALAFYSDPAHPAALTLGTYSPYSYYGDGSTYSTEPNFQLAYPDGYAGLASTDGTGGAPTMRSYAHTLSDNGGAEVSLGSQWAVNTTGAGTIVVALPYTFTASVSGMQPWAQVQTFDLFELNFGGEPTNGAITSFVWAADGSQSQTGVFNTYITIPAAGEYTFGFTVYTQENIMTAVPEPETWALIGLGLLALVARRQRGWPGRAQATLTAMA